jgi:ligand-binding sensor domain-containing protein
LESLAFYWNNHFIIVDFTLFLIALKLPLSIFFLFASLVCLASGSNIKVFTSNDGLPSSYVFTAFQDRSGYIWVGTYGGISRFDGRNFVNFTVNEGLGSNQILKIIQDKKNNIIAGSFFGVSIYDGVKFRNIEKINGVSIGRTRTLIEDKNGDLWGGCRNGLWKMETSGKMQLFSKDQQQAQIPPIWSIYKLESGKILVGTPSKFYAFDGKTFVEIKNKNGESIPATIISNIDGKIIMGTYRKGWYEFKNGEAIELETPEYIQKGITYAFASIVSENWVAATSEGLVFKGQGYGFYRYSTIKDVHQNPLPTPIVLDCFFDSETNLWLSTPDGLIRMRKNFVEVFNQENGFGIKTTYNITQDNQQNLYFMGFEGKVLKYENNQFKEVFQQLGLFSGAETNFVFQDSKNNFWISEYNHIISRVSPNGKTKADFVKEKIQLTAIIEDKINDIIWIGGRSVLFEIKGDSIRKIPFAGDDINALYLDHKNRLWLGGKGLWMYDGKQFHDFSTESNTENVFIVAIQKDKQGNLFLGTVGRGIRKIQLKESPVLLERINISEGLINESIFDLQFDDAGLLWASTFSGIQRINLAKPKVNQKYQTKVFDLNDGIINDPWRMCPLIKDKEGNIWAGSSNGVMKFKINEIYQIAIPPKVHITRLQLFQKDVNWQNLTPFTQIPQNLTLNSSQNFLTFYFGGINFSNPENVIYSYKLEHFDESWSPLTKQNNISYTKLNAGKYTFRVKAMNSDGFWSEPTSYSFEIEPHWLQTWWARMLMVVIATGAIYWFLKNREKEIEQRNQITIQMTELKLKAIQSQMNPHFLFNSLNSVQNYILTNRGIEGAKFLSKFSKLVRRIMENSNHQYLRFEQIIETLKMYVEIESFRFNHEFHYEFEIENDELLLDTQLPPMLLQPFVENSIWHGLMPKEGSKQLIIKAFRKDNYIFCSIEDNGVGRKNNQPRTEGHISRGQEMTKGIFDSLRNKDSVAKLEIIDLLDNENKPIGTKVEMVIPIDT